MPSLTITGTIGTHQDQYGPHASWFLYNEVHGWPVTFAIPSWPAGIDPHAYLPYLDIAGTLWEAHPVTNYRGAVVAYDRGQVWVDDSPAVTGSPPLDSLVYVAWLYADHLDGSGEIVWSPAEAPGWYYGTPYGSVYVASNGLKAAVEAASAAGGGTVTIFVLDYQWDGLYGPYTRHTGFETLTKCDLRLDYDTTGGGGGGEGDDDTDVDSPGIWNLETDLGRFYRSRVTNSGSIRMYRSEFTVPKPWAMADRVVTSGHVDAGPRFVEDHRGRLWLVFARTSGGSTDTYETYSEDAGYTWSTPAVAITHGVHPHIATSRSAISPIIVETALVSGVLKGRSRAAGDTAWSDVFTCKDDAAVDLALAGDSFCISHAAEAPSRWVLSAIPSGEAAPAEWWSADECRTWTRLT